MGKQFKRPRLKKRLPAVSITEVAHEKVVSFALHHNISIAEVVREAIELLFLPENFEKYDIKVEKVDTQANKKAKRKERAS